MRLPDRLAAGVAARAARGWALWALLVAWALAGGGVGCNTAPPLCAAGETPFWQDELGHLHPVSVPLGAGQLYRCAGAERVS